MVDEQDEESGTEAAFSRIVTFTLGLPPATGVAVST